MAIKTVQQLKSRFKTGDKPTQQDFADVFDSYRHKQNFIHISEIDGYTQLDLAHRTDLVNPNAVGMPINFEAPRYGYIIGVFEVHHHDSRLLVGEVAVAHSLHLSELGRSIPVSVCVPVNEGAIITSDIEQDAIASEQLWFVEYLT
jgi:hypothetical protein